MLLVLNHISLKIAMYSITTWDLNGARPPKTYRRTSNIRHNKSFKCFSFRLAVCLCPHHWSQVLSNEDVVGAAPTSDAPNTSEWSKILLPTDICLILEFWWYYRLDKLKQVLSKYSRLSMIWRSILYFILVLLWELGEIWPELVIEHTSKRVYSFNVT